MTTTHYGLRNRIETTAKLLIERCEICNNRVSWCKSCVLWQIDIFFLSSILLLPILSRLFSKMIIFQGHSPFMQSFILAPFDYYVQKWKRNYYDEQFRKWYTNMYPETENLLWVNSNRTQLPHKSHNIVLNMQ